MKANKRVLLIFIPLTLLLFLSVILIPSDWTLGQNICLSLLGSAAMGAVISAINYQTEKRRLLEDFFQEATAMLKLYRRVHNYDGKNLEQFMVSILSLRDHGISQLGDYWSYLDFFLGNGKSRFLIYNGIYKLIQDNWREINLDVSCFHFEQVIIWKDGSRQACEDIAKNISAILYDTISTSDEETKITTIEPAFSSKLSAAINVAFTELYDKSEKTK